MEEILHRLLMAAEKNGKNKHWLHRKLDEDPQGDPDKQREGRSADTGGTQKGPPLTQRYCQVKVTPEKEEQDAEKGGQQDGVVGEDPLLAAIPATVGSTGDASQKTTNGEHISVTVKECLKSFAPLLFNSKCSVQGQVPS
ncbi:hypothetical protein NDU88_002858 [Pleurodeles waltl]|uniref:Uncharacterized protein n=1 Tax=Pleurodeles waltl TaxID=8319 RepID=A0AAV7SE24_PLEWA|nr:hypothetical protein NDU88_002858 [Pleurodeles waltl]